MQKPTLTDWTSIAQIIGTFLTLFGIMISLYYTRRALEEIQKDREINHLPFLYFEPGGYQYPIKFKNIGNRIPGIEPSSANKILSYLPNDKESVLLDMKVDEKGVIEKVITIGNLKNYGVGPAFTIYVKWIPQKIYFGNDGFEVGSKKLEEPIYRDDLNTMPCMQGNLLPNESSGIVRLPLFIEKDYERKISRVDGVFEITCKDIFNKNHKFIQNYYLFTNYNGEEGKQRDKPSVHITFLDI